MIAMSVKVRPVSIAMSVVPQSKSPELRDMFVFKGPCETTLGNKFRDVCEEHLE
jgi:hypothetical protein